MAEINPYLEAYYNQYDEDGRLASRHGQVEYLTTMRYIGRYLRPGMRVLEIGAGTGRYCCALAAQGYAVDAIELVAHNIDILTKKITPDMRLSVRQGNALALPYADAGFDLTLLLGPMYHLYTAEDQRRALGEAIRVTKPGGLLYVAYCGADPSIIDYGFAGGHIVELIDKGLLDPDTFEAHSNPEALFALYRPSDIDRLTAGLPMSRLHFVATDLWTRHIMQTVDAMDDKTFALYLDYHFACCERPDLAGLSHHTLDIARVHAPDVQN